VEQPAVMSNRLTPRSARDFGGIFIYSGLILFSNTGINLIIPS